MDAMICYNLITEHSKHTTFTEAYMSSLAAQTILTPEEYIASERKATLKSEYLKWRDTRDVRGESHVYTHYRGY